MYRHRTRPAYSFQELVELYKHRYNHENWPDHVARVEKSIELGFYLMGNSRGDIADLSCGDGAIAGGIQKRLYEANGEASHLVLGDITPGYELCGPIEETIEQVDDIYMFICSETLEHLDYPDDILSKIRQRSQRLLLSTPKCTWPDPNPEHYWSWDNETIEQMLREAGWFPVRYDESYTGLGYTYQIWSCV